MHGSDAIEVYSPAADTDVVDCAKVQVDKTDSKA
jgi:hypothetical protein